MVEEDDKKWWNNQNFVAFLGVLVALVVPTTTGISTYIKSRSELALQKQQQLHEIQLSYLDRALDPENL